MILLEPTFRPLLDRVENCSSPLLLDFSHAWTTSNSQHRQYPNRAHLLSLPWEVCSWAPIAGADSEAESIEVIELWEEWEQMSCEFATQKLEPRLHLRIRGCSCPRSAAVPGFLHAIEGIR